MNPRSPFYRGGRATGRGDGGRAGRFNGGRGRGGEFTGRGVIPHHQNVYQGGGRGANYYNDRGNDHGQGRGPTAHNYHYQNQSSGGLATRNYESAREHHHYTNEGRGPPPQW